MPLPPVNIFALFCASFWCLHKIWDITKHKYKDLPPKSRSLLDDGMLRVNVIKKDSHRDIKYDIFMRLNRGAEKLKVTAVWDFAFSARFGVSTVQ